MCWAVLEKTLLEATEGVLWSLGGGREEGRKHIEKEENNDGQKFKELLYLGREVESLIMTQI